MDRYGDRLAFIWAVKEVLRDVYKRHQYREVILPLAVLRRLDCVLQATKDAVLVEAARLGGDPDRSQQLLLAAARHPFYNTSKFTFKRLVADQAEEVHDNLLDYLNGFSPNIREILKSFGTWDEIKRLDEAGLLYEVVRKFAEIDLHPATVSNAVMGQIYEELIRRTADLSNEEAGEHYTPREVIRLMVDLLLTDDAALTIPQRVFTVYDPTCGTGGMLTEAERRIHKRNAQAKVHLFGQEVSPETWALCQTDMLLSGHDPSRVKPGSTLSKDGFPGQRFHYMIANPPYGKKWETDKAAVQKEAKGGASSSFPAGLPKITDGQTLFLQMMLTKMRSVEEGGSRVAVVMSYSPLSNGEPGERENSLRKWILDRDLLDCVVALPEFLFYNTPIFTCVWILSNRKPAHRKDTVQLIDARDLFTRLRWPQGKKRSELSEEHMSEVLKQYELGTNSSRSKILPRESFGYRRITVAQPLRLRWTFSPEARAMAGLQKVLKRQSEEKRAEVVSALGVLDGRSTTSFDEAEQAVTKAVSGLGVTAAVRRRLLEHFSEADEDAPVLLDEAGHPVPDPHEQDDEYLPLDLPVNDFMQAEITPYSPDAFVVPGSEVVGYEIPVTVWFHRYQPPRPLAAIREDLDQSVDRVRRLLVQVTQ